MTTIQSADKPKFKVIKKKKEEEFDQVLCDRVYASVMGSPDEEEEDCVCGNNFHKGWVDGVMRCEDCDIDGKNYEGSDKEADVVEIVGCDAECGQDSKYSDMYGNNYCSKKCEYRKE